MPLRTNIHRLSLWPFCDLERSNLRTLLILSLGPLREMGKLGNITDTEVNRVPLPHAEPLRVNGTGVTVRGPVVLNN